MADDKKVITRRTVVAAGAAMIPAGLFACGDATTTAGDAVASGSGAGGTTSGGGMGVGGSGGSTSEGGSSGVSGGAGPGGWAAGGTAGMTDKGSYPDPFDGPLGAACPLIAETTLGPCYANTLEREDISEGEPGLPTRLALLVVDASCGPVAGATVDIWHTNYEGFYSGSDAVQLCTLGDADAMTKRWCRGTQTTGSDGKAFFDTCFPGWYGGRAIHIHFQVRAGNQIYTTSQLFFPADLVQDVFATHQDYATFGQPDTPNSSDGIYFFAGELEVSQMTDGAMLAWKVLAVPA